MLKLSFCLSLKTFNGVRLYTCIERVFEPLGPGGRNDFKGGTRLDGLSVINGDFIVFSMTSGNWFEFGTLKGGLIDGRNLCLKVFFNL